VESPLPALDQRARRKIPATRGELECTLDEFGGKTGAETAHLFGKSSGKFKSPGDADPLEGKCDVELEATVAVDDGRLLKNLVRYSFTGKTRTGVGFGIEESYRAKLRNP
jgi:hypothetical protein